MQTKSKSQRIESVLCDFFEKMLIIHRHGIRWIYLVECDLQLLQMVSDLHRSNIVSNGGQTLFSLQFMATISIRYSNIFVSFLFFRFSHLSCLGNVNMCTSVFCLIIRMRQTCPANMKQKTREHYTRSCM